MAARLTSARDDEVAEISDINVTPFIDVMLVLLIIFMVAAPLSTSDVAVELPVAGAPPQPRPDEPVFLTLKADLTLALGEEAVTRETLTAALEARTRGDHDQRLYLRADRAAPYGELMQVLNLLRDAGYLKVGLVGLTDAPGAAP